jgi:transcriptional regulator with XRE-family HTH domain
LSRGRNQKPVDTELIRIARRIREWREGAGLTLQDLARRSDVATSTIQKVETFQMIPTVAVLLKIARGLGKSASEFVSGSEPVSEVVHLTPEQRHPVGSRRRMIVERLSGDLLDAEVELWRVSVQPGRGSGREPLDYRGEEIVVCEEGEITFRIAERDYLLGAGDTLHFKASVPHSWQNDGDVPARFLILGTVPAALRGALQDRVAGSPQKGARRRRSQK